MQTTRGTKRLQRRALYAVSTSADTDQGAADLKERDPASDRTQALDLTDLNKCSELVTLLHHCDKKCQTKAI